MCPFTGDPYARFNMKFNLTRDLQPQLHVKSQCMVAVHKWKASPGRSTLWFWKLLMIALSIIQHSEWKPGILFSKQPQSLPFMRLDKNFWGAEATCSTTPNISLMSEC